MAKIINHIIGTIAIIIGITVVFFILKFATFHPITTIFVFGFIIYKATNTKHKKNIFIFKKQKCEKK